MSNNALNENLKQYSEHGFSLIKEVIPQSLIDKVFEMIMTWENDYIANWYKTGLINQQYEDLDHSQRFLKAWQAAGKPHFRRQPNKYLICAEMYEILTNQILLDLASQFLKTSEISVHGIFNTRPMLPESEIFFTRAPWHQDSQYWGLDYNQEHIDDPKKSHVLTMFMPLQNIDTESGCLSVMSTKDIDEQIFAPVEYDYSSTGFLGLSSEDIKSYSHTTVPMNKGDLLCFNHMVPHGTNPLKKQFVRWSFDIRYEPTEIATNLGKKFGFIAQSKTKKNITPVDDWINSCSHKW